MSGSADGPVIQIGNLGPSVRTALAGLPPVPAEFTGREADLAEIADVLRPESTATTVAIHGLAGVGKTTVALKAAHEAITAGWFPGGALFIDLQGYSERRTEPVDALSIFLQALGE